jgi:hypothetical protein
LSTGCYAARLGQRIVERFLRSRRRYCQEGQYKRDTAIKHVNRRQGYSVWPYLQAACHFKDRGKNTVDNEADDNRDQNDNKRRNEL